MYINEDDKTVHFYNFKNPKDIAVAFPSTEVDKLLTGLQLIINNKLGDAGGNVALKRQAAEITKLVPSGYRIHLVSSGSGLQPDIKVKLDSFIGSLGVPEDFCTWSHEDIHALQTRVAMIVKAREGLGESKSWPTLLKSDTLFKGFVKLVVPAQKPSA